MIYREAHTQDIPQLFSVRMSVKENILMTPSLVTDDITAKYLSVLGKGWLCETEDNHVVGFAIADLTNHSIWALFVRPEYEGMGIGKKLHDMMLHWYFDNTTEAVWLTTAPGTRAETFYRNAGWKQTAVQSNGEIKFELTRADWKNKAV